MAHWRGQSTPDLPGPVVPVDLERLEPTGDGERREVLDRVFRHDLLNLVGGLEVLAARLAEPGAEPLVLSAQVQGLAQDLAEAIRSPGALAGDGACPVAARCRELRPRDVLARLRRFGSLCPAARGKRLEVLDGPEQTFFSDLGLLVRILVNLVKNALEATPWGGTVRVWHERTGDRPTFLVENPGALSFQAAERVFQLGFSTKDGADRGLGSFGARLLAERSLGAEVGFRQRPGPITRFQLLLPAAAGPAAEPTPGAGSRVQLPCLAPEGADTLLLVDDSRTLCSLLGSLLCPRYRVLTASSGEEGLALALEQRPDLILLDVRIPGPDGFAVCTKLKADSRTRDIPVLFLTALGGEAEEMRALEAGGIDFILKPVSPRLLAARVRNQLQLKHRQDGLRNLTLLDCLTGIANRRRFDQYLELEWHRCSRNGLPLSMVMGDVDHFKAYNDGYGHGRGDKCLQAVAKVFDRALRRPADLAARYGGEEFVCVLPETDRDGARIVADQIMEQMALLALPHAFSPCAPMVTVSVGVATAVRPTLARSWKSLVEEADMWMYVAKGKGRNRVEGADLN
jgi:diguanylate cyclase (GGDEF)-like protein